MLADNKSDILESTAKFFIPIIIGAVALLILYLIIDEESVGKLFFLMFAYFVPPLGKESVIPIGVKGGEITIPLINKHLIVAEIDPLVMGITIAFVDIIVALFLVWNYDIAKKIPLIGKFMEKIENIGKSSSDKYGWIKPLRFIGIVLFVMVPFQGSGAVVGSILGRLIGMKPWTIFFGISTGALTGCLLIAYFSDVIFEILETNFLQGLLLIIVLFITIIMLIMYKKSKKNKIINK